MTFATSSKSQNTATNNLGDIKQINSIFDKIEAQGVDTKQKLLYGYFFFDKDNSKLEKLKTDLINQSYKFVEIANRDKGELMLHVEKAEQLTRQTLFDKEQHLRQLASQYKIERYDGFDVGNPVPTKPLVSKESFSSFILTKKRNALFDLGIKLYNLEINDKAEIVFRECIKQNIKTDTAYYKLGNTLIGLNKIDEGIDQLEKATKVNPNYLSAFYNLGATCYDNQKYQKSLLYYQQADKLRPNDDSIIYGIAASQFAIQQYDKSLENCKKALQLNSDNENAKILLKMLKGKTM